MQLKIAFGIMFLLVGCHLNAQYKTELVVAKDGSGDFTTIQQAIDGAKSYPEKRITIFVQNGVYHEKVKVHTWNNNLTIKGEDPLKTIIWWDDHFDKMERGRNSTFHTPTFLVQGENFRAENLTIENRAGAVGQAVAVAVEADRCVFENCRMLGHQDTLFADGANTRQYFQNCYIEGTTDFIFGGATALFENCTIHSKSDSYITAASTPQGQAYGFVFLSCKLTAADDVKAVYLGRPWRSFAQTVFIDCQMGAHILPKGWDNWNSPEKEKTVLYAEYGSTGAGANSSARVPWATQLSRKQAKKYRKSKILKPYLPPKMKFGNKK